ncbi:MAG: carbohydrate-binding domain-containing protein [Parasporobacterium sp.]|nr:carbohydrate-binding domain-containing protein [Parasporobacterium sp.]
MMKKRGILAISVLLIFLICNAAFAAEAKAAAGALETDEMFTDRDLMQTADLTEAVSYSVNSGEDIHITQAGIYALRGNASEVTVYVEADDEDKVQLVLDGVSVTNSEFPCIYVTGADKVFVTTSADSSLSVTGSFVSDGDTHTDGVIFSRSDLVLNGTATLTIDSSKNGVVCKDDLKITGGSYFVNAASKCFEANDSIRIADGTFALQAGTDGLHAENEEDDTLGYLYIRGGNFVINADDDGLHATSIVQIDSGSFEISAAEGIEGTWIQINDGTIRISSWDDGINGAQKSDSFRPTVEINGGDITVSMTSGDTDAIDCNGDLIINGGTIDLTGPSAFDYDGAGQYNGGTIIVNGQQQSSLPNQMGMGKGGSRGGRGF